MSQVVVVDAARVDVAYTLRPVRREDRDSVLRVVAAAELLDDDGVSDVAGELDAALEGGPGAGGWLVDLAGDEVAGAAFYAPERMTNGTWNLLMLAVHPDRQRQGRGGALVRAVEADLRSRGARLLVIETSGLVAFAGQRRFYAGLGYGQQGWIEDFFEPGDAKVVYAKPLALDQPVEIGPSGLRIATHADLGGLLELAVAFYAEDGFTTAPATLSSNLRSLIVSDAARVAVIADSASGGLEAFAVTTTSFGLESGLIAELEDLYVVPSARRSGLGAALVDDAARWAHSRGCALLDVVIAPNGQDVTHLHRYYEALGFVDDGRRLRSRALRSN